MPEVTTPCTPIPEPTVRQSETRPLSSPGEGTNTTDMNPKSSSSGTMTPPPSTQLPKHSTKTIHTESATRNGNTLASPPSTLKAGPPIASMGLYGEVPSLDSIQNMTEEQLRSLVSELLPALGEARVSAAHTKLQHNLLSIETEESAKRAEVEHEATRREFQVLQEGSPVQRHNFSPRSPQAAMQRNLHLALAHCRELQDENAVLERHLRSSKKIISQLDESNANLKEHVQLLRHRIKENRDHLNEMQSTGAISINGTPVMEYGTPLHKGTPRTPATNTRPRDVASQAVGSQDPFDALLFAGQVLNGEASSVPSTPYQSRPRKTQSSHVRGAHSLSSLPNTPNRSRPVTADSAFITPGEHNLPNSHLSFSAPGAYHEESHLREDRDGTISASDDENSPNYDEDITGSQASQAAASMLRRSLGPQNGNSLSLGQPPESSSVMQSKLFGQIRKPGVARPESSKRGSEINMQDDDIVHASKKAKVASSGSDPVGLGIRS